MGIDRLFKGIKKGNLIRFPFIVIMSLYVRYSLLFISSANNHMTNNLPRTTDSIIIIGSKMSILTPRPGFFICYPTK